MYHSFLIHSSADGHLGCFHVLAIINSAAMNIGVHVWRSLKKLEIDVAYDPAIPLLGIHTKETRIEKDMGIPVFITALFIIARTWKQPRCPSADEWIRKLWYIYTMDYYSAILPNHLTLPLSHRVQKTVLYICVSFAVSHTGLSLRSF